MKRFLLPSPTIFLTFILGMLSVLITTVAPPRPSSRSNLRHFEIRLDAIEVKDSDVRRWNLNDGYLDIFDAEFLDEYTILALYLQDGMRISHDGGKTWARMFEPSGLPGSTGGFTLHNLEFLNSKIGWAGGSCLIATQDGGQTWQNIKVPEWMDNIEVGFLTEKVGFVAGRSGFRGNTSLAVYKTVDGGKTWKKSFRTKELDTPWDIVVVDSNVAMVTAGGGWLWRTEDGGKSWKRILKDYHRGMSISRSPDGRFWLFGKNSIRTSDDLGASWKDAEGIDESLVNHEWWSVDFADSGLGVAVGEDAAIAITKDGGLTWRQVRSNLHSQEKIRVPNNPFDEALRGIRLSGNRGIINGSQRDYFITISDQ